jgi:cyclopropane-fatty-acyl-phospholipid synthase
LLPPRRLEAEKVFCDLLSRHLSDCHVVFQTGAERVVAGAEYSPRVATVVVNDPDFYAECLTRGSLGMAECYMRGGFDVTDGTLAALLEALLRNQVPKKLRHDYKFLRDVLVIKARNVLRTPATNVRSHYDLGPDLFAAFLDPSLTYSCGYARDQNDSLEALQRNKLDRICKKLRLSPGDRLLDIGCGFGGLLIHAAKNYGVHGVGITTSRSHHEVGSKRIADANLSDRLRIELRDHTEAWPREFDRVVSVGMMEHLARSEYRRYVRNIARALKPGGLGLVHAIGCNGKRNRHDPFIQKYIFPGSAQPKLSEITHELESHSLLTLDVENIVRHYAYTCQRWLENFLAHADDLPAERYDARFRRMWQFYLEAGTAAARAAESAVYQVLFTNDPALTLPLARV